MATSDRHFLRMRILKGYRFFTARLEMTLNQLKYFCCAARCHSITQAAKLLFVTQPAVTIAIRELEKEFSISLFTYSRKGLELTEEGERFYQKASELLMASDEIQEEFMAAGQRRPTIRLGIPPNLGAVFFPELMDRFHEEYPDIYLELSEYGSVRACNMVQDEQLDMGLVNMELYAVDKFENQPLFDEKRISLSCLDMEPVILFNQDSVQNQILNQRFHSLGIRPRIIMHCSQITTTLKFVRQGKCGCFFFSSMLPLVPELHGIEIDPEIPTNIGLVWKKGKYITSQMNSFINFCRKYYLRSEGIV